MATIQEQIEEIKSENLELKNRLDEKEEEIEQLKEKQEQIERLLKEHKHQGIDTPLLS